MGGLERVNLADFLRKEQGLDTVLSEKASNLSGGQCQRLALARALLRDSPVHIFDEATSNIDVESENDIMRAIHLLAGKIMRCGASHVRGSAAEARYPGAPGRIEERGTFEELMEKKGYFYALYTVAQ